MYCLRRLVACGLVLSLLSVALADDKQPDSQVIDKAHEQLVYSLAVSPDGKTLASAGFDGVVKLWELPSFKLLREIKGHTGGVYCVAFNKNGDLLASSSVDKTIRLSNPADGKLVREI